MAPLSERATEERAMREIRPGSESGASLGLHDNRTLS
jgi:hypothetical protein